MFRVDRGVLIGDNGRIAVELDLVTGGIHKLRNVRSGHVMVDQKSPLPWRIQAQGGESRLHEGHRLASIKTRDPLPTSFEFSISPSGNDVALKWETTDRGVTVEVKVRLEPGSDLELWPMVEVAANSIPPVSLTYPLLESPQGLSDDPRSEYLAFPGHSGWLIRRPLEKAALEGVYPEGYAGTSIR